MKLFWKFHFEIIFHFHIMLDHRIFLTSSVPQISSHPVEISLGRDSMIGKSGKQEIILTGQSIWLPFQLLSLLET